MTAPVHPQDAAPSPGFPSRLADSVFGVTAVAVACWDMVLAPDAWVGDSTVSSWSNLYLEDGYFTASSNPYVFDPARVKWGNYTYDPAQRRVNLTLSDSVSGVLTVDTLAGNRMALHGVLSRDTIALSLTRVKPLKWYRVYFDWRTPAPAVASGPDAR